MKRHLNPLTPLVLVVALASPVAETAEAAEAPATYYKIQLTTLKVPAYSTPQLRSGMYRLQIEGERRARLKLIPQGSTAAEDSHSKWIPIESMSPPLFRKLLECDAEDIGRRGTLEAGRKLGRQQEIQVSIPGRRGCDLRATFRVDLGSK